MRVFLSWSGGRSNEVATSLKTFLKGIIQRTEPWMSSEDIRVGQRWFSEVSGYLQGCGVGILCLTRDNLSSPWLNFEAGALSKQVDKSLVCPYLLDLEETDVAGPLSGFQAVRATEEGTRKLVRTINSALGESKLADTTLTEAFQLWWPRLAERLENIRPAAHSPETGDVVRRDRDLLEEILVLVRKLSHDAKRNPEREKAWRQFARSAEQRTLRDRLIDALLNQMNPNANIETAVSLRSRLEALCLGELETLADLGRAQHGEDIPPIGGFVEKVPQREPALGSYSRQRVLRPKTD